MSYKIALVCLDGHVVTRDISSNSSFRTMSHCPRCGLKLTNVCLSCGEPLHGNEVNDKGQMFVGSKSAPPEAFCYHCGKPYPWTESRFENAELIINELDCLSDVDKEKLCRSLKDLYSETPQTAYAVLLVKKAMLACKGVLKDSFMKMLVDFCCAAVKSQLGINQ